MLVLKLRSLLFDMLPHNHIDVTNSVSPVLRTTQSVLLKPRVLAYLDIFWRRALDAAVADVHDAPLPGRDLEVRERLPQPASKSPVLLFCLSGMCQDSGACKCEAVSQQESRVGIGAHSYVPGGISD